MISNEELVLYTKCIEKMKNSFRTDVRQVQHHSGDNGIRTVFHSKATDKVVGIVAMGVHFPNPKNKVKNKPYVLLACRKPNRQTGMPMPVWWYCRKQGSESVQLNHSMSFEKVNSKRFLYQKRELWHNYLQKK